MSATTVDLTRKRGGLILGGSTFKGYHERTPVLVVPLNDESLTALLGNAIRALSRKRMFKSIPQTDAAITVMQAIGLLKKPR